MIRYRGTSFGTTTLVINGLIVVASALVFDIESALYTLISIFVTSKTYDMVLHHMDKVALFIMTSHGEIVADILKTYANAETTFVSSMQREGIRKQMLFSVLVNDQVQDIKEAVLKLDPESVISIIPTKDVIGGHVRSW